MPLLAGRTVMITVAREDEKTVRVCVIPKKVKEDDHPGLTTPLSYTGTPEELDAELGKHLASYVECHNQLGSTLAQAKAEMEAAAKAAQEEARKKAAERNKKSAEKAPVSTSGATTAPTQAVDAAQAGGQVFGGVDPEARVLDGGSYPHPALVFKVTRRELFVRALARDERPTGETPLKTAPYWNCGRNSFARYRTADGWKRGPGALPTPRPAHRVARVCLPWAARHS
jgi:PRTRC genetic system protein E